MARRPWGFGDGLGLWVAFVCAYSVFGESLVRSDNDLNAESSAAEYNS